MMKLGVLILGLIAILGVLPAQGAMQDGRTHPESWQLVSIDQAALVEGLWQGQLSLALPGRSINIDVHQMPFVEVGALVIDHSAPSAAVPMPEFPLFLGEPTDSTGFVRALVLGAEVSLIYKTGPIVGSLSPVSLSQGPTGLYRWTETTSGHEIGIRDPPTDCTPDPRIRTIHGDAHNSFYLGGTPQSIAARQAEVINGIAALMGEACIYVTMAGAAYWTCFDCPAPGATDSNVIFQAVQDHWELPEHQNIDRDLVLHMVSKGISPSGLGIQAGCCEPNGYAYALSVVSQPYSNSPFMNRMMPTHETGHLFDGNHEYAVNWEPNASPPRMDCPDGSPTKCTIMSATLLDASRMIEDFSSVNRQRINNFHRSH